MQVHGWQSHAHCAGLRAREQHRPAPGRHTTLWGLEEPGHRSRPAEHADISPHVGAAPCQGARVCAGSSRGPPGSSARNEEGNASFVCCACRGVPAAAHHTYWRTQAGCNNRGLGASACLPGAALGATTRCGRDGGRPRATSGCVAIMCSSGWRQRDIRRHGCATISGSSLPMHSPPYCAFCTCLPCT
jgi:hypothetical protein